MVLLGKDGRRLQAFLRDEVANFQPTAADLDFPACLQAARASAAVPSAADASPAAAGMPATPSHDSGPSAPPEDAHATWYPPLRQTLVCLARLYRSVELPAFCAIGQDALRMCTTAIEQAARQVNARAGALDGHLFAIRHLLLLREQISPFQAEFTERARDLDFSHMRGQMQRVLAGDLPIFALSRNSAVAQLVAGGGVRVLESQVDSKQEVEKALKAACEAFIVAVTTTLVQPMLSFLHKVTAAKAAAAVRCELCCRASASCASTVLP